MKPEIRMMKAEIPQGGTKSEVRFMPFRMDSFGARASVDSRSGNSNHEIHEIHEKESAESRRLAHPKARRINHCNYPAFRKFRVFRGHIGSFRVGSSLGLRASFGFRSRCAGSLGFLPALLLAIPLPLFAQSASNTASLDYSSLNIIAQRNIFNPRRYPTRPGYVPRERPAASRQAENFALLGTMVYEKGPVAFFDGSNYSYRKATAPAETIGGFTVQEIQPDYVKLASGSNQIELHVGMELRRDGEGQWRVGQAAEPSGGYERTVARATTASTEPQTPPQEGDTPVPAVDPDTGLPIPTDAPPDTVAPATEPAPPPGGATDILTRLRQRREQEDNR